MRTRSRWLLCGILLVAGAALVAGPQVVASPQPELTTGQTGFPLGGVAELDVTVEAGYIGGHGDLYATVDGQTEFVMSFPITATAFGIEAPVPGDPDLLGEMLGYQFQAFLPGGIPGDESGKTPRPIVDPEFE